MVKIEPAALAVEYGQEQITSTYALLRILRRTGFEVIFISMSGFIDTTVLPVKWLADPGKRR